MTPGSEAARVVLLEATALSEDDPWRCLCDHLARAVTAQGRQTDVAAYRVRRLLDHHGLGAENHPNTWKTAELIVAAVRKETEK